MKRFFVFFFLLLPTLLSSQELVKVRISPQWIPQSQFAGIYMALEKGFYRDAGLDVEIIHPTVSNSAINLLKEGKTDVITSMLVEALLYEDAGVELVNFLQISYHNSLTIVSREPIPNVSDLNHKKIGQWKAGFSELAMVLINTNGLDVTWVPFLSNIALFISGAIDATICMSYNEYYQLKMSGFEINEDQVIRLKNMGYDVPEDGLYTTKEYYQKHPEVLKNFAEATKKGWEWVRLPENREETLDRVMKMVKQYHTPSNRVNQKFMLDEILRLQEDNGVAPYYLSEERFDFALKILIDNNFLINTVSYQDFVKNL